MEELHDELESLLEEGRSAFSGNSKACHSCGALTMVVNGHPTFCGNCGQKLQPDTFQF